MNLRGSIAKLQNTGTRLYLTMAQYFKENKLIRDIWLEMAHDKELQLSTLRSLPRSFWTKLEGGEVGLDESLESLLLPAKCSGNEEHSLLKCFTRTLEFEEPIILRIYPPLIRQLRTEWTDHALDFYIMVKAHVARLLRVVQLFSGDPVLVNRAGILLENFEKEVQKPESLPRQSTPIATRKAESRKHKTRGSKATAKAISHTRHHAKRGQGIPRRSKSLVKNLELQRRRARR
jgi:hypothetical protein